MKTIKFVLLVFVILILFVFNINQVFANTPTPIKIYFPIVQSSPNLPLNQQPRGNGIYLVNSEIASGMWRSNSMTNRGCSWYRYKNIFDMADNILGFGFYANYSGGIIDIQSTDFAVQFVNCGIWTYIQNEPRILQENAFKPHQNGVYMVGVDIAPGIWITKSGSGECYWEIDKSALGIVSDVMKVFFGSSGGFINIPTDALQFRMYNCIEATYYSK